MGQERIQKQIQRKKEQETIEEMPEIVDESEILEQTEIILGRIAIVLEEKHE